MDVAVVVAAAVVLPFASAGFVLFAFAAAVVEAVVVVVVVADAICFDATSPFVDALSPFVATAFCFPFFDGDFDFDAFRFFVAAVVAESVFGCTASVFEIQYNNTVREIGINEKQQSTNTFKNKTTWYSRLAIISKTKLMKK